MARDVLNFWKRYGLIYVVVVFTMVITLFGWWWWIKPKKKPTRPMAPPTQWQPAPPANTRPAQPQKARDTSTTARQREASTAIEDDEAKPEDGSPTPEIPNPKEENDVQ